MIPINSDLRIVLVAAMIVLVSLSVSLFAAYFAYKRRVPYLKHWGFTSALVAAGYGTYALSKIAPSFVYMVISNLLIYAGMCFVIAGAAAITKRKIPYCLYLAGMCVTLFLFILFGYCIPSYALRNLVITVTVSVSSAIAAWLLFRPLEMEKRHITALGAWLFVVYAAFYLLRSILLVGVVIQDGLTGYLPAVWEVCLMLVTLMLFVVLGTSFFTMMGGLFAYDLEKSLKRSKALIHEIHHRTKNNILLISSLISLHENEVSDETSKKVFNNLKNRLDSIMTVYRMLGNVEDGQYADVKDYLEELCNGIQQSVISRLSTVRFNVMAESQLLEVKNLVSIGLIVNETVTNALKHAFPDNREGIISIYFVSKMKSYILTIRDDGIGIDTANSDTDVLKKSNSLGLVLIRTLANQLNGTVSMDSSPGEGTEFTLEFSS